MSVKNDTPKVTPIICGAVYRKEMPDNSVEYATMIGVIEKNGTTFGILQRYGYSPERVTSGQANFKGWDLFAEPGIVKTPKPAMNGRAKKREQAIA
mgnify:CR=1 FL=1|tara:strand:+ start:1923 stop:2210 length:288 start_codon:yes stop_codon:yes gene_type:complete